MHEHPGVFFQNGATGRRARLVMGPDIWEVMRVVKSARVHEPDLSEDELLAMLEENTGVPVRLIRVAIGYWAAYPDEIDAEIAEADEASARAEAAWRVQQQLIA